MTKTAERRGQRLLITSGRVVDPASAHDAPGDVAIADGRQSVILPQVTFGIAVRMAVMSIIAGNTP